LCFAPQGFGQKLFERSEFFWPLRCKAQKREAEGRCSGIRLSLPTFFGGAKKVGRVQGEAPAI
jgi:hypothetical protein